MDECDQSCESCAEKESCTDPRKGILEQQMLVRMRMERIRHKIIIASGKGGVGKSTVAVNLARALANRGYRVGLLDADITGPNVPKLLGVEGEFLHTGEFGIEPADAGGIEVISMALVISDEGSAVVWRGPMKMMAISQFLSDVNWGDLDFLIIDLPPGTSDEPLSIVQLIPELTGAIIVTTPQDVALLDSIKAVNMVKGMDLPVLGIIENMSGLCCPHCGEIVEIFKTGGGRKAALELGVPFLGALPIEEKVCHLGDSGATFVDEDTSASKCFLEIVERLLDAIGES